MRRWRVLEDARAQERRRDPERIQRRDFGKLDDWIRCANERWMGRVLDVAGGDKGDRADMLDAVGIGVDPSMQLRRNAQEKSPEKRSRNQCRDQSAAAVQ